MRYRTLVGTTWSSKTARSEWFGNWGRRDRNTKSLYKGGLSAVLLGGSLREGEGVSRAAFGVGKVRGWGLKGFGSVCLVAGVALLAGGSVRAAPGDLDAAFGEGGVVRVPGGSFADVLIQSDGKIVAAGKGDDRFVDDGVPQQSYGSIALARYEEDGSLDPGFGSGGFVVTDLAGPQSSKAWGLLQQPDGKIVVAGHSLYPPYAHYSVGG